MSPNNVYSLPKFHLYSKLSFINQIYSEPCPVEEVLKNKQALYLAGYLQRIRCESFVVEDRYIDNDFLQDFARYYSSCTSDEYIRHCFRLHFFTREFDTDFLEEVVYSNNTQKRRKYVQDLNVAYLGFTVIKPLPKTIVGRTVLKQYPKDDKDIGKTVNFQRKYFCASDYDVNLFGIPLKVNGIAFQEQDQTSAACASTCLWTAFHGVSQRFASARPSPSRITETATTNIQNRRSFPSRGLNVEQICHAIIRNGLAPETWTVSDIMPLPAAIYGYLRAGIPTIMLLELRDKNNKVIPDPIHAITVVGHRVESCRSRTHLQIEQYDLKVSAQRVSELYAHDDNIGPYARMKLIANPYYVGSDAKDELPRHPIMLVSDWLDKHNEKLFGYPDVLIWPVNDLIRVSYGSVYDFCNKFSLLFNEVDFKELSGLFSLKIEWDIYLSSINDYKMSLAKLKHNAINRDNFLVRRDLPKYLWIARAFWNSTCLFDLVLDASDVESSLMLTEMITHDTQFDATLTRHILENYDDFMSFASTLFHANIHGFFVNYVRNSP